MVQRPCLQNKHLLVFSNYLAWEVKISDYKPTLQAALLLIYLRQSLGVGFWEEEENFPGTQSVHSWTTLVLEPSGDLLKMHTPTP